MNPLDLEDLACAWSGESPLPEEVDDLPPDGDLPVGWLRVTVTRCFVNPEYAELQGHKEVLVAQMEASVDEAFRPTAAPLLRMQVDAMTAALEAQPRYSPTIQEEVTVHIAPPDRVPGLAAEVHTLLVNLGCQPADLLSEDELEDAKGGGTEGGNTGAPQGTAQ